MTCRWIVVPGFCLSDHDLQFARIADFLAIELG